MKEAGFDKLAKSLETKMTEYETSIQTLATLIMCMLLQSGGKVIITQETVMTLVNRDDFSNVDFEFNHLENGDGELILKLPEAKKEEVKEVH